MRAMDLLAGTLIGEPVFIEGGALGVGGAEDAAVLQILGRADACAAFLVLVPKCCTRDFLQKKVSLRELGTQGSGVEESRKRFQETGTSIPDVFGGALHGKVIPTADYIECALSACPTKA